MPRANLRPHQKGQNAQKAQKTPLLIPMHACAQNLRKAPKAVLDFADPVPGFAELQLTRNSARRLLLHKESRVWPISIVIGDLCVRGQLEFREVGNRIREVRNASSLSPNASLRLGTSLDTRSRLRGCVLPPPHTPRPAQCCRMVGHGRRFRVDVTGHVRRESTSEIFAQKLQRPRDSHVGKLRPAHRVTSPYGLRKRPTGLAVGRQSQ